VNSSFFFSDEDRRTGRGSTTHLEEVSNKLGSQQQRRHGAKNNRIHWESYHRYNKKKIDEISQTKEKGSKTKKKKENSRETSPQNSRIGLVVGGE